MGLIGDLCGLEYDINPSQCVKGAEGFEDVAIVYNRNDIAGYTFTEPTIKGGLKIGVGAVKNITEIQTKFGKRGFVLIGSNDDKEGGGNYEAGVYTHLLNFRVKNADHEYTQALQEMNAGKCVAVVGTNNENFRVLGRVAGLVNQTANNEIQNADTQGGYQVNALAKAKAYPDYFGVYEGVAPNQTFSLDDTREAFNELAKTQWFDISSVVAGATETTVTLSTLVKRPYVDEAKVGMIVEFKDIVGTIGTDATNGLNGKKFAISAIVNETTFKITAPTGTLVYTSGGEAR